MGGGGGSFGHIHWCEEEEGAGRWPRASTGFPYGCRHSIQKLVLADNYKWRRYEGSTQRVSRDFAPSIHKSLYINVLISSGHDFFFDDTGLSGSGMTTPGLSV